MPFNAGASGLVLSACCWIMYTICQHYQLVPFIGGLAQTIFEGVRVRHRSYYLDYGIVNLLSSQEKYNFLLDKSYHI